jgi:hypothetical protein
MNHSILTRQPSSVPQGSNHAVSPSEVQPLHRGSDSGRNGITSVSPESDLGSTFVADSSGTTDTATMGLHDTVATPQVNGDPALGNVWAVLNAQRDFAAEMVDDPRILELICCGIPNAEKLPQDIHELFHWFYIQMDIDQISIYHPNPCTIIEAMQYGMNWVIPRVIQWTGTMNSSHLQIAFPPDVNVEQDGR